jgi:hypothetical protein
MPRHAKSTKLVRNRSMLAGLKKHSELLSRMIHGGILKSPPAVAARFQAHLDALDEVATKQAAWRAALGNEESLEKEIKKLMKPLGQLLASVYGAASPTLRDFGLAPRKSVKISAEKMVQTVAKRNATRNARHTMGKKQKKAIKGTR